MLPASWRIALASVIGTSHFSAGLPCQDRSACEIEATERGPVLVAIICDGAGSAAYADMGAALAAETCLAHIKRFLESGGEPGAMTRETAARWVKQTAQVIGLAATEAGHAVRDYACTLLAAVVGEHSAAFFQIGDGAIVVSEGQDDGWAWVFWPQHGEFANSTNFITSEDAAEVMEFCVGSRAIRELAMFSDGIENLVLHSASRTVHAAFFDAMFPPVRRALAGGLDQALSESLVTYLSSPVICERTDDDKSLILATCRSDVPSAEKTCEPRS